MNRLKKILRGKTAGAIAALRHNISKGVAQPFSDEEIEFAVDFLRHAGETYRRLSRRFPQEEFQKAHNVWRALIYSKSDTKVAKLATEFLENKRLNVCDPLRYLLYTIKDKTAVDSLLQRVFDTNDPALRLIAAEYLMNIDTNRGLAEMIKILPIIEFDHATADSIAIWLGKYGDKKLKHKLEEKEIECKKSGEPNSASWYKWAASTIG